MAAKQQSSPEKESRKGRSPEWDAKKSGKFPPIQSGQKYFPFTNSEYDAYQNDPTVVPGLFARIREAASEDIRHLMDRMVEVALSTKDPIAVSSLDGPISRDAFLTRVEDALMYHQKIEADLEQNSQPIPQGYFDKELLAAAELVAEASVMKEWEWRKLQELNARLIILKSCATALLLRGQLSAAMDLFQKIVILGLIETDISSSKLEKLPHTASPMITQLKIVSKVLGYIDRDIVPMRVHLEKELTMNSKNFHDLFTPLQLARLIPFDKVSATSFRFYRKRVTPQGEQQFFSVTKEDSNPDPPPESPTRKQARVRLKGFPGLGSSKRGFNYWDYNYYHSRRRGASSSDGRSLLHGSDPADVRHDIELIKERLGGIYWFVLCDSGMPDLETKDDLEGFLATLRGMGLSLDF